MKHTVKKTMTALLLCLLIISALVFATGAGSSSDPVVTLSYLEKVFGPELLKQLEGKIDSRAAELEKRFDGDIAYFSGGSNIRSNSLESAEPEAVSPESQKLLLETGEILEIEGGLQLLVTSGRAVFSGAEGSLSDISAGTAAALDEALALHHLYISSDKIELRALDRTELVLMGVK